MNLNRALVILSGFLLCLVIITVINLNFNRSKSKLTKYEFLIDTEVLLSNIQCIPEIIRSYEKVKDIHGVKNSLFFRYIKNDCSSCLNSDLNEILTLQEEIGKDHIWIFPAYPDNRESRIQLSNELAKYNYRNISADSLYIPTYAGEQKSYFAWINNDGEIDMVFIPDRNKIKYTRDYFQEVKKKILQDK